MLCGENQSQIVTGCFQSPSPRRNPILRFVTGGSVFISLTSWARRIDILDENLNDGDRPVVTALQLLHTSGNVPVAFDELTEAHEGTNDGDAHMDSPVTVKSSRKHGNAMFSEGKRLISNVF
jgi:hypothetical protein